MDDAENRTLIVARADAADTGRIAELFAESDDSELPQLAGVTRRTLFSFHGLYFHLIESRSAGGPDLPALSGHLLFTNISTGLRPYVRPYDPHWRGPQDAVAAPFYQWSQ
jgi:hypothetical protein